MIRLLRAATLGTLVAGLLLPGNEAAGQSLIDRGDGHRIRPFIGAGTAGYNLGLEGEYSLLPYVSVVGSLKGWVGEEEIECFQVSGEGTCPPADEGWGAGIGVRLSASTGAGCFSDSGCRSDDPVGAAVASRP